MCAVGGYGGLHWGWGAGGGQAVGLLALGRAGVGVAQDTGLGERAAVKQAWVWAGKDVGLDTRIAERGVWCFGRGEVWMEAADETWY